MVNFDKDYELDGVESDHIVVKNYVSFKISLKLWGKKINFSEEYEQQSEKTLRS